MLNLGRIEAFDPQYFVAGIPALLLLVVTLGAIIVAYSFAPEWAKWLSRGSKGAKIAWVFFWLLLPSLLVMAYAARYFGPSLGALIVILLLFTLSSVMVLLLLFSTPAGSRFVACAGVAWGAVLILFYSVALYGSLPQELGGGASRCAQLDLRIDQVSPETASELLADSVGLGTSSKVVRTKPLSLLIGADNQFIVLQGHARKIGLDVTVLDRSAVAALKWCEPTFSEKMMRKAANPSLHRTAGAAAHR